MTEEDFDETIVHAIQLERVAAGQQGAVLAELRDLEQNLVSQLVSAETLTPAEKKKAAQLLSSTGETINGAYAKIIDQSNGDLTKLQEIEVKDVARKLNGKIGVDVFSPSVTEKLAETVVKPPVVFGLRVDDWWKAQGDDYHQKFQAIVKQGMLLGEPIDKMVDKVRGTKAQGYTDGIAEMKRREATALVRTAVISNSNQAKLDTFKELPVIAGIEWVSTLDTRTTHVCKSLSGLQWRLPDYEPISHDKDFPGPTAHFSCRSTQVAVTYSWKELGAKKVPVLSNKTISQAIDKRLEEQGKSPEFIAAAKQKARASIDGPVAASSTFESWLSKKSDAYKRDLLGPGRFELWDSGKISLRQLTDQQNRPLTLKQLEAVAEKGEIPPAEPALSRIPNSAKEREANEIAAMVMNGTPLTKKQQAFWNSLSDSARAKAMKIAIQ